MKEVYRRRTGSFVACDKFGVIMADPPWDIHIELPMEQLPMMKCALLMSLLCKLLMTLMLLLLNSGKQSINIYTGNNHNHDA
ncbi:transmembrane protein, putative [Medicago truncatula]|uniref:Transmembrane protein, putative n=1 Tax=Medicago truncatula TaxID=3880 RepID=G7JE16_MEDTR|nr:transmembrane protein, putative [Medicago truncatula]